MSTQRKFENVQLHQEVTFWENGMIHTGVVCEVKKNTFIVSALRCWNKNGVKCFRDAEFNFNKTGKKAHHRYTYGDAIEAKMILL